MNILRSAIPLGLLTASTLCGQSKLTFKKVTLSKDFVGEGVSVGDFNKDGNLDVAAGVFLWYGPDFTKKIKYGQGTETYDGTSQYASYYMNQAAMDINGDGWMDIPVYRGVGQGNFWQMNPKGSDTWSGTQNTLAGYTGFESNALVPLFKNGSLQLLSANNKRQIGWSEPNPDNPTGEWKFHVVGDGPDGWFYALNTHGLGMGDVNLDGRNDVLAHDAWFEQPPALTGDPKWIRHNYPFHMDRGEGQWGGSNMFADDVDGDGDGDIISSLDGHGWGLAWFEQIKNPTGTGTTFTPHILMDKRSDEAKYGVAFSQLHSLAYADMNGDGLKDIVTGKRVWAHGTGNKDPEPMAPGVLYAFVQTRGPGGTTFKPVLIDSSAASGCRLELVDMNKDGYNDVAVSSKKGTFVFLSVDRPPPTSLPKAQEAAKRPESRRLSIQLFPGESPLAGNVLKGRMNGRYDVLGVTHRGAQAAGLYILQP